MALDLSSLNLAQQEAVMHTEGPTLILAGPGSGKTRVLIYRVAYLIEEKHVFPYQIMVLTFTKKAANEMKERLTKLIGADVKKLSIGTFHSVFSRILRQEATTLNFSNDFSIYDQQDGRSLVKRIIQELKLDKNYDPKIIAKRISYAKSKFIDAQAYEKEDAWRSEDYDNRLPLFYQIYAHYQSRCRADNAMDYDDLLFYTYQLFQNHPDILEKYQKRYQYLLVDEFQDTNECQLRIVSQLAGFHQNLFVIGDDAQSIYSFRGANIENILTFSDRFSHAKVIKLEKNYRSTPQIVEAANRLIQCNQQHSKKLVSNKTSGDPILLFKKYNDLEEAGFIADHILLTKQQKKWSWGDFAILCRQNFQTRILEEALVQNDIPYKVIGSLSFYQRKEIKDLIAYLTLLVNPSNSEALRRAINQPKRNIGPVTLDKIDSYAREHDCAQWEVISSAKQWIQGKTASKIEEFATLIETHKELAGIENAHTVAKSILHASGLMQLWQADTTDTGKNRCDNIEEFISSVSRFCERKEMNEASLSHFLESITLLTSGDEEQANDQPKVQLMTIHKAKGLEFSAVYIPSLEEGMLPNALSFYSTQQIEEERRLFFVAITRAKEIVIIVYAENRYKNGKSMPGTPSRFLQELGLLPKALKTVNMPKKQPRQGWKPIVPSNQQEDKIRPTTTIDADQLQVGMSIVHPIFDRGVIENIDRSGMYTKLKINFVKKGRKTLLLEYTNIAIVSPPQYN